jgi:hypothetical protein
MIAGEKRVSNLLSKNGEVKKKLLAARSASSTYSERATNNLAVPAT